MTLDKINRGKDARCDVNQSIKITHRIEKETLTEEDMANSILA